jgi:hypothetical protein
MVSVRIFLIKKDQYLRLHNTDLTVLQQSGRIFRYKAF